MGRIEELQELTSKWNDAWNSRDTSKLAAFFAPEGTYYEPDLESAVNGATGIGAVAERTWRDWPEATFEEVSVTISDPRVVLEWRSTATHSSGKVLNLEGVDILEWDGGKLSAARVYYDVHGRKTSLGK
jgi:ketosteroid isomerase-like protein